MMQATQRAGVFILRIFPCCAAGRDIMMHSVGNDDEATLLHLPVARSISSSAATTIYIGIRLQLSEMRGGVDSSRNPQYITTTSRFERLQLLFLPLPPSFCVSWNWSFAQVAVSVL